MFNSSYHSLGKKRTPSKLMRLLTNMILASLLPPMIGNFGLTAQASPYSDKTTYEFRMQTSDLPDTICPNSKHPVKVIAAVDRFYTNAGGMKVNLDGGPSLSDLTVQASVSDSNVAVIEPGELQLRALDLAVASSGARFTLYAKKAGTTTLRLTASGTWAGEVVQFLPLEVQIKVTETCKYRVQMIWQWRVESQGTVGLATGWLNTVLTLQDGVYKGGGFLDTVEARLVPGCNTSHSGFQSPTEITGVLVGSPGDEELQLTFHFQPGATSFTATCFGRTSTSHGSEDPTAFLVGSATFPKEGGSQSFPLEFGHGHGTMTVQILPVEFSY